MLKTWSYVYGTVYRTSLVPAEKLPEHVVGTVTFFADAKGSKKSRLERMLALRVACTVIGGARSVDMVTTEGMWKDPVLTSCMEGFSPHV